MNITPIQKQTSWGSQVSPFISRVAWDTVVCPLLEMHSLLPRTLPAPLVASSFLLNSPSLHGGAQSSVLHALG